MKHRSSKTVAANLSMTALDHCAQALANNGGSILARVASEQRMLDLTKMLKSRATMKIGSYIFDKRKSILFETYGICMDGWGDSNVPCLVIFEKRTDMTPPSLDKYSIDYGPIEPESKVIDDIKKLIKVVEALEAKERPKHA